MNGAKMSGPLVIHGKIVNKSFISDDPMPDVEAPAELIVYALPANETRPPNSMFDVFGKARRLRSAEELDAQLREERDAWNEP